MRIEALHHVQLAMPVGKEALARRFYAGLLEIPEVPKPPHLAKLGRCWFERGSLKIHIGVEIDFCPALKAHPAFMVTDMAALVARLKTGDVGIDEGKPLPGICRIYMPDPFGNRIELFESANRPLLT